MSDKLNDARKSLLRVREAAQERLTQLEQERREIVASIKSLDAALKSLDKQRVRKANATTPLNDQP